MMRLFIALPLSGAFLQNLTAALGAFEVAGAKMRWCSREQMHLTLKFLGEASEEKVAPIVKALETAAAFRGPLELECVKFGVFPPRGPVNVIWAGFADSPPCSALASHLDSELAFIGFEPEKRDFVPHVTLARVKDDRSKGALRAAIGALTLKPLVERIGEVQLIQSKLSSTGASYTVLGRARL